MSVEKLLEEVLHLEKQYGLRAQDLGYSERILALFKAIASNSSQPLPDVAAVENEHGTLEGALAAVKSVMHNRRATDAWSTEETVDFVGFQEKVRGTNINEATLLATDYLNHFNEIVMILEMVPTMTEMLEDAIDWNPKSYQQHFRDSQFSDKELAIEAYNHVPARYRNPFESTIVQLDQLVKATIEQLEAQIEAGELEKLQETVLNNNKIIQRLLDVASGIINGGTKTMEQDQIDNFI